MENAEPAGWRFFAYRTVRGPSEPFDPNHPVPTEQKLTDDYRRITGFSDVRLERCGPEGNPLPENQRAVYVKA